MKAQIKLGQLWGIEIGLHYSGVLTAVLIILSLANHSSGVNAALDDAAAGAAAWLRATVTSLLFFAAVLAHEMSHAAVAKMRGLTVKSITLFAFGGVTKLEKETAAAAAEFWMGNIGLITSFAVGLVFFGLARAFGGSGEAADTPIVAMLVWFGTVNIALAIINLLPGYPFDGGRVLRAVVWRATGNAVRAARIAARAGQFIALFFIVSGILNFAREDAGFGGLWLAFIGFFLFDAARASDAQAELGESLQGLRVGDVLERDFPVVGSRMNLQTLVDDYFMRSGGLSFFVAENGQIVGLITAHEVKEIKRPRWLYTTVDEAMLPLERLPTIDADATVADALEKMQREDVSLLPVMRGENLEGFVSRDHILKLFQTRAEFKA